jgi:hypothetical protein
MIQACHKEVIDFHVELEAWLRGDGPRGQAGFSRLEFALAPECKLITPGGVVNERAGLLERLFQSHGVSPDMRIRVEGFAPVWTAGDSALVRYIEWRESGGQTTGRYSAVLFRADREAPAGVVWVYMHETWMAGHGPQANASPALSSAPVARRT